MKRGQRRALALRSGGVQADASSIPAMRLRPRLFVAVIAPFCAAAVLAGCGSSKKAATPPSTLSTSAATTAPTPTKTAASTTPSAGALQAEANSAATGDIPDNQVFLTF